MKARHLVIAAAVFAAMLALWLGTHSPDPIPAQTTQAQTIQPF